MDTARVLHRADLLAGHADGQVRVAVVVGVPGGEVGAEVLAPADAAAGLITVTVDAQRVPGVSSVDHLTVEGGRAITAENREAYVAEYGEPA
ncbi:hypothetical protein ACIP2Y_25015 [Streptomyces sviceus]|uniref:hypothetical protein n=1 Tax=Streptomyces sviceus TaxID=285530 RepID=UPI003820F144